MIVVWVMGWFFTMGFVRCKLWPDIGAIHTVLLSIAFIVIWPIILGLELRHLLTKRYDN